MEEIEVFTYVTRENGGKAKNNVKPLTLHFAVLDKFYQHAGWFLLIFCQNLYFNTQMSKSGVHNTNRTKTHFTHFPENFQFSLFSPGNSSEYAQFM